MKRIARYGLILMAIGALSAAPSAWATCNLDTQAVGHTLGGTITNCPDANPIEAYIWLLSSPTSANSAGQEFVCRHETQTFPATLVDCQSAPGSGVAGDGTVTTFYEWGTQNTGAIGCPNATQAGIGVTPLGVSIVCNNGASVLLTVGFHQDIQQYPLELAGSADGTPISASFQNGPSVTSVTAGVVCVNVPVPTFQSDCDPGAFGFGFSCNSGSAEETPRPAPDRGLLMSQIGPCAANPDLRVATWTATPVQPDPTGSACNAFNPGPGLCTYIGVQGRFGGVATGGIISYAQVGGPSASSDKVKIDSATTEQGKVKVAFSTTNETAIVGFNVYSDGAKLNSSLITSKGVGNNAYSYEIGRGALKGGKTVLVEAVKKDGSVEKTSPVALK